ncbi:Hypothetical protein (Fragment), partial [Durusdinium trenchii]
WSLPSVDEIAFSNRPVVRQIALEKCEGDYIAEGETMRESFPELVWSQSGKPTKVCLGPRGQREDWDRFKSVCPSIVEAVEQLLHSFSDQKVEVTFGDVLDYGPGHLLGWHQDSMDLTRHLFTVVLTLASEGSGRCEWRKIAEDGQELQEVVSSTMPALGNLAIHGLTCNNELAHRVFWDEGRRLALVLFCRSPEIEALLKGKGAQSRLSMRYWWRKEHEKVK